MALTIFIEKCCNLQLVISLDIRKPNRYQKMQILIQSDFYEEFKKLRIKNFGLHLQKIFIIFLKNRQIKI